MRRLIGYLNQPFQQYEGKRWHIVLIISLIVFAVLAILQPFDISRIENGKFFIVAGFGMVTMLGMVFIMYTLPFLFPSYYNHWTIWKNILNQLLIVVVITFGNALYSYLLLGSPVSFFILLFVFLKFTLALSVIPVVIVTFFEQNRVLKRNLEEARLLNQSILQKMKEDTGGIEYDNDPVVLEGNTKDSLEVYPQDILYIEASGNYVNVWYVAGDKARHKMLRATIRQIEEQLSGYDSILRTHRAFLVNAARIVSISGNSQGYRLTLPYVTEEIPVSRAYAKELRSQLTIVN